MNELSINTDLIMKNFEGLSPGEDFVVSGSEDPRDLLQKIKETVGGSFNFQYLEQGPVEWKVLIRKKLSEGCCGCCGGE